MSEPKKKQEQLEYREMEDNPLIRMSALPRTPPERKQDVRQEDGAGEVAEEPVYTEAEFEETAEQIPVRRSRAHSLPESTILLERVALPRETDEERPAKRKRERTQNMPISSGSQRAVLEEEVEKLEKLLKETTELVKKVRGISGKLSDLVIKNPNTKVEIKRGVEELEGISARLEVRGDKMALPIKELIKRENRTRVETATQTEGRGEVDKNEQLIKNLVEQEIEEALKHGGTFEDFKKVMNLKWPSKFFRKDISERTGVLAIPRDWDLLTFVTSDFDMENGVNRTIRDHYQGLEDLKMQVTEVGDVAYLLENISFPARDGTRLNRERYICYGIVADVVRDTWNLKDVYAVLQRVRDLMIQHGRKKLALVAINKIGMEFIKKAIEFVFAGTEMEVKIVMEVRDRSGPNGGKMKGEMGNIEEGNKKREEVVIVKAENGKSFAETLKRLRSEVDMEATGVKVAAIRKTRSGDVLLRLKTQQEGNQAQSLKEEIMRKMSDARVQTIKESEVTLHINGIDGVTDREELERAVRSVLVNPTAMVKVNGLWPAFGQSQNAAVTLHKREAEELIDKGSLTVGWVTCKVRERVNIRKCFQCWGHGHHAGECRGINREQVCMKCGMEGHKAKGCQNEEMCWECEVKGHRGGTTKCPKFRQMLTEAARGRRRPTINYD